MSGQIAPPTEIRGGSHGVAATYARVRALATAYDTAGNELREQSRLGTRVLANGDLLESAPLSPVTFADAEAAVAAATIGPHGLFVESLGWEADALVVRATVTAFEDVDQLVSQSLSAFDRTLGRAAGFGLSTALLGAVETAPIWLPGAVVVGGSAWLLWQVLPDDVRAQLSDEFGHQSEAGLAALQEWVDQHPELAQHALAGAGGFLEGFVSGLLPGLPPGVLPLAPTTEDAAALLAGLYPPDGDPSVQWRDDLSTPAGPAPLPGSLADLMTHLQQVNDWSGADAPENNGTIEIQSWTDPTGVAHHIVYLPGTDDLSTTPWSSDGDVRDLPTNLVLLGGGDTAYGAGIVQAMHEAGIGADDPVLVVGHSQGGLEASWLAGQHDFNVTQVVSAGAPTGAMGEAPGVPTLSLEHRGDLVPLLDGADNPDTPSHVTVTFDEHETAVGANHDLAHYVHGAAGADASTHPSITDQLQAMHDQGFLTGDVTEVTSTAFQITRAP